jgi:hypothetical protein
MSIAIAHRRPQDHEGGRSCGAQGRNADRLRTINRNLQNRFARQINVLNRYQTSSDEKLIGPTDGHHRPHRQRMGNRHQSKIMAVFPSTESLRKTTLSGLSTKSL